MTTTSRTTTSRTTTRHRPLRPVALLSDALPSDDLPPGALPTLSSSAGTRPDLACSAGAAAIEPIGTTVRRASDLLGEVVSTLEPARLTGADAARLYELLAGVERLAMAGRTLLAPRIDESGVWRDTGHRNATTMLAGLEGVPTGQARNTLEVGQRLTQLPGTEEALRSGSLSGPKVSELSGAAVLDPSGESELLRGAADEDLRQLKERCQRARATSERRDPVAAVRRIHHDRFFTSWTDGDGAFCFRGRDTADRGARILQQMDFTASRLFRSEDRSTSADGTPPERTTEANRRADAFFLLLTGAGGSGPAGATGDDDPGPPGEQIAGGNGDDEVRTTATSGRSRSDPTGPRHSHVVERPPNCSVMVRVDIDALLRGRTLPGEVCEIDNQGPIPVAMARDMADDSYLRFVFHRAGDIRAVSHFGRTINRSLRTALAHRDRCCVVPGCGVAYGLEIDHVLPFAEGGPTALDNLALLCHRHHYLKTYEGWTLERHDRSGAGPPDWSFTPMPAFGEEPDPDPPDG
jgi:hypothetical protein